MLACARSPGELPKTAELPEELSAFTEWLQQAEATFDDIEPGAERTIQWANPAAPQKTPLSIVYFHGYSASRQEVTPVCEKVGEAIGANVYFARLSGHGRSDDAMAEATLEDWLAEAEQALQIGHKIGDNVVIVGTSTGATLGSWLVDQHPGEVAATVYMSPNFGPKAAGSRLLLMPGRSLLTRLIIGEYREWEPYNEAQATYWTHRYPAVALFPMMDLVQLVDKIDFTNSTQPAMFIYSPNDTVIRADLVEERMAEMGGVVESLQIAENRSGSHHVLAGDIIAPENNDLTIQTITDFLVRNLGAQTLGHNAQSEPPDLSPAGASNRPAAHPASHPPAGH